MIIDIHIESDKTNEQLQKEISDILFVLANKIQDNEFYLEEYKGIYLENDEGDEVGFVRTS